MENTLIFCKNMFGTIKPEIKERLQAVIDNPNEDTWDDAHSLIISPKKGFTTLWQAVLSVDPTFQRRASIDLKTGKTKWNRIPSSELIKKSIKNVVYDFNLN